MKHLVAGILFAAALPALADGQASIVADATQASMQMDIYWADGKMRMNFPSQQQDGYMLLRDGKGYMVTSQGGQTIIMDMSILKGMADAMGGKASAVSANQAQSVESLEATGEEETVAGINGEAYRIQWTDRLGNQHDDEMILSDDPLALEMLAAFQSYAEAMTGEPDPIGDALLERGLGMLRYGDKFKVVEIADATPAAGTFELPDNAMTMQEMIQQSMSSGSQ